MVSNLSGLNHLVWKLILFGIPVILVWGVMGVFVPVVVAEIRYQASLTQQNLRAVFPQGMNPDLSWPVLPAWVGTYAMEIPKIGVREQIVEAVDVTNEEEYFEALTEGIAQARGTGLPGEGGIQYYFAHSSGLPFWGQRAVVFALLNKLDSGDEVIVYREGTKYEYKVVEKQIVLPEDTAWLKSAAQDERVVLQTCWPIGTNWKRLLVIAKPVESHLSGVDRGGGFDKISLAVMSGD